MNIDDIKNILTFIRNEWYRPFIPLLLIVLVNIVLFYAYSFIKPINSFDLSEFGIILSVSLLAIPFWFFNTRIPKAPKEHIGFAIAIAPQSKEQHELISKDFARTLRELLSKSQYKYKFSVIEFPEYYSNKIENGDIAIKYLEKSQCKFMVFGIAKIRKHQGKMVHALELEGAVTHAPITTEVARRFSQEFAELFPRKLMLSSENDLLSFQFTSELVNIVSKYIIGIASLLSGDIDYAQALFEDIEKNINSYTASIPAIAKIKKRIPKRLHDVYLIQARFAYEEWRKDRKIEFIEKFKHFLNLMQRINSNTYILHAFYAIYFFIANRDTASAKRSIRQAKQHKDNDNIWILSLAFLYAYERNMASAISTYKKALKHKYLAHTLIEIEDFILWILKEEPNKIQFYFCLGFVNYKLKNDMPNALKYFRIFLEKSSVDFLEWRSMALELINELTTEQNL